MFIKRNNKVKVFIKQIVVYVVIIGLFWWLCWKLPSYNYFSGDNSLLLIYYKNNCHGFCFKTIFWSAAFEEKYRPFFFLPFTGLYKLFGLNNGYYRIFNGLLLGVSFWLFYVLVKSLKAIKPVAILAVISLIVCRYSFFHLYEIQGILEIMPIIYLILMIYLINKFDEKKINRYFMGLFILYTLAIFTNERYLFLAPFLGSYFIFRNFKFNLNKKIIFFCLAIFSVSLVNLLVDTVDTHIVSTFSGILNIIGYSPIGESSSYGFDFSMMNERYQRVVGYLFFILILIMVVFIKKFKKNIYSYNILMMIFLLLLLLISASATINQSGRFILPAYLVLLIILVMMTIYLKIKFGNFLVIVYLVLNILVNIYGRSFYRNIYLFPSYNLAERYMNILVNNKKILVGKTIYLLNINQWSLGTFNNHHLYDEKYPEMKNITVKFVDDKKMITNNSYYIEDGDQGLELKKMD